MADRDSTGKFVKGCKTGGARPGAGAKPLIRREILDSVVSESDWRDIYAAVRDQAVAGDIKAAEWLDVRRWGKIAEAVDAPVDVPPINILFHSPPSLLLPAASEPEPPKGD